MAKVSFSKVAPKKEIEAITIKINDQDVIVQQYLPVAKKSEMIGDILDAIMDVNGIRSAIREPMYFYVYLVKYYTNINITETMLSNASSAYDALLNNGVLQKIIENIPSEEYKTIHDYVFDSIKNVADYRTSALGVITELQNGAMADTKDADEVMKQLTDMSENSFLSSVLTKMG